MQPVQDADEQQLIDALIGLRARDITPAIIDLIVSGKVRPGMRLPTVRALSHTLGIGHSSVAASWNRLREDGWIETRRRGGTFINADKAGPSRHAADIPFPGWSSVDLTSATADTALCPNLDEAIRHGLKAADLNRPRPDAIVPELLEMAQATWPWPADAWTTASGGSEATVLAVLAAVRSPSLIAVEQPTIPRVIETLKMLGHTAIGVACDSEGPLPDALEQAAARHPAAFIYQPRAQMPLGHAVTRQRLRELAGIIERSGSDMTIIENDDFGPLSVTEACSMGEFLPDRTLFIRVYCKAYGLDLRTSIIGGSRRLIEHILEQRSFGVVNSRILQSALAFLMRDPEAAINLEQARKHYALRRQNFVQALKSRDLGGIVAGDGFTVLMEVQNEFATLTNLTALGVRAAPGSPCFIEQPSMGYIRIAISKLPEEQLLLNQLADYIQRSASGVIRELID